MKNKLTLRRTNKVKNISNPLDLVKNPGDNLSARVTSSGRKVLKLETGDTKYSATQYPNGTVVQTKTIKKK